MAFQCYSGLLGVRLPMAAILTGDADIAQDYAIIREVEDSLPPIVELLRGVDASFRPVPHRSGSAASSAFQNADGYRVEFLTSNRGSNDYINLGFIRPVENIGSLRFLSIAHERYLLAVARDNPIAGLDEICISDLRDQKIIGFQRQNLSYTERYFAEKFEEHDLAGNVAYTCDDSFSLVSLVSAGLRVGFAPEWTAELPDRDIVLKKVRGIDFRIGLGVAWNKEDPTAARDDIIDIARSLARPGK